jgi:hypothetical protein
MSPMLRRLAPGLSIAAAMIFPVAAVAAPTKVPQGPEQATVKIARIGHLHEGRAEIYSTVPVVGSVVPFAPHQKVDVTFYLDGHKLLRREVKVSQGKGDAGLFQASIVVRKDG